MSPTPSSQDQLGTEGKLVMLVSRTLGPLSLSGSIPFSLDLHPPSSCLLPSVLSLLYEILIQENTCYQLACFVE